MGLLEEIDGQRLGLLGREVNQRPDRLVVVGADLEAERDAAPANGKSFDDAEGLFAHRVEFGVQ